MLPGDKPPSQPDRSQYIVNLALAAAAGQVGCLTLVIILAALLGGLWLDGVFKSKPLFTLGLVIGSMPIALFVMYRVAVSAVKRIKPSAPAAPRVTEGKKVDDD